MWRSWRVSDSLVRRMREGTFFSPQAFNGKKGALSLPDKWRGGRTEKFVNYWRNVARDYAEAAQETREICRRRPRRAAAAAMAAAATMVAAATNPDERDFEDAFVSHGQELACTPDAIRNPEGERWQSEIWRCKNEETIRRRNLLVFSLLWRDDCSKESGHYSDSCSYLRPGVLDILRDRVVDVGFLGHWWMMERRMKDFDINPNEWDEQGRPRNPHTL